MQTQAKSSRRAAVLVALVSFFIVGCVDTIPTVLRDKLSYHAQNLDLLMHVVDGPSATVYVKGWQKRLRDAAEKFDDRQKNREDNMEKEVLKKHNGFMKYVKEKIASKTRPKDEDFTGELADMPKAYRDYASEMVANNKAYERELERITGVLQKLRADPAVPPKDYEDLKKLLEVARDKK